MNYRYVLPLFLALLPTPVLAEEPDLSDVQRGTISQNCQSIKTSLKSLQRSDARTRVLLGQKYQTILSDYLAPLNVRLVKNNQPNSTLTNIHSSFVSERDAFTQQFVKYSQSLETLINIDCQAHPDDFYRQLSDTRTQRASLNKTVVKLGQLNSQHITAVTKLRDDLKKEKSNV